MLDFNVVDDMAEDISSLIGFSDIEEMFDEITDSVQAENEYFDDGFLDSLDDDY